MQLLYVVNFDVSGANAYDRVLGHIAQWLGDDEAAISADDLATAGSHQLRPARVASNGTAARHGDWETVDADSNRALKLVVSQAVATDLELTTRVTISDVGGETRFRIGIGRENIAQTLVPVTATEVFQPHIVRMLDNDTTLSLRAASQPVTGRYLPIRSAAEARVLGESLPLNSRLPLVLIHVRTPETWDLARELSRKLIGLAITVTLNFETARVLATMHPRAQVPFGGMALVWPGMSAAPIVLTSEKVSEFGVEQILRFLTQQLGSLSALGHGSDELWHRAKTAADTIRMRELLERAEEAREGGDTQGEIAALEQQVEALTAAKAELESIGESAMQSADSNAQLLRVREVELEQARNESKTWRELYHGLATEGTGELTDPEDPWEAIPILTSGDDPESTFLALTDAASEHIVFTDRARKAWKSIDYPEPEDMTTKLIALARAAVTLYEDEQASFPHLDTWFKEKYDLNVALTDQTISKWKRKEMRWLNAFEHEEETLNATPHVKVRDAVKFNECGRIHFAFEQEKKRLVVQHVGIKTYA